jgi:pimeloyl-ACP methyl ester carboxylesterase
LGIDNPLAVSLTTIAGGFNSKLTSLKDIQVYIKGVANLDLDSFLILFEELMSYDGEPMLHTINVPTLVISGENDHVTPEVFQLKMKNQIPNAEYLCVPYGSHCTQLDFPDFVNLRMDKFFKNHFPS